MATHLSSHSVKRLKERANVSSKREAKHKAVHARQCGYTPADFQGSFKDYLMSKAKSGKKVKVHCEFIYIFDGTRLVTSYEVPKKYQGKVDNYLVSKKKDKNKVDNTNVIIDDIKETGVSKVETKTVESSNNKKSQELSVIRHSLRTKLLVGCDKLSTFKIPLFMNSIYGGYQTSNIVSKDKDYLNDGVVNCFVDYVLNKLKA